MREWIITGILVINIIMQSTLFPFLEINSVKPDLLLTLVVSFSLMAGNPTGAVVGLAGGLLQDILFGDIIGVYALQYMLIGYFAGMIYGKLYIGRLLIPVLLVFIISILRGFFMLLYCFFARVDISFYNAFFRIILVEAAYTSLFMPVVYFLIGLLYRYKFMRKKRHFD